MALKRINLIIIICDIELTIYMRVESNNISPVLEDYDQEESSMGELAGS